jgi:hypothetical protein
MANISPHPNGKHGRSPEGVKRKSNANINLRFLGIRIYLDVSLKRHGYRFLAAPTQVEAFFQQGTTKELRIRKYVLHFCTLVVRRRREGRELALVERMTTSMARPNQVGVDGS